MLPGQIGRARLWPRRLMLEASQPFLLKGMDRIAHELGCTAQIAVVIFTNIWH